MLASQFGGGSVTWPHALQVRCSERRVERALHHRELLDDVLEEEVLLEQLLAAGVAEVHEAVLLRPHAVLLEDQPERVRRAARLVRHLRRDQEELALAHGLGAVLAVDVEADLDVALELQEELLALVVVVVLAGVRAAGDHHDEGVVALEDRLVGDRRDHAVTVLRDPRLQPEGLQPVHDLAGLNGHRVSSFPSGATATARIST